MNKIKNKAQLKKDIVEMLIAMWLLGIAIYAVWLFKEYDPYFNPFDLRLMAIIAIIGLCASVLCTSFEGAFPGTFGGTVVRAVVLTIAIDVPNFITIGLLIITYVVSICYLKALYNGRIAGIVLGIVSIICFPYFGVIVLFFMEMLLGSGGKSNTVGKRNKK